MGMPDPHTAVTVEVPASGARLAADQLHQAARDARDAGDHGLADTLATTADALWTAGWTAAQVAA